MRLTNSSEIWYVPSIPSQNELTRAMFCERLAVQHVDRLPVLVSSGEIVKILDVPALEDSKGVTQAYAIYTSSLAWGIEADVECLSCDTCPGNMGRKNGAAALLERLLQRTASYFPRRHHIYELAFREAFETKFPGTISPTVALFKKLRDSRNTLDQRSLVVPSRDEFHPDLRRKIPELVAFIKEYMKKCGPGDDYEELLELSLIRCGAVALEDVKFRISGAFSHARLMGKGIHLLKLDLLPNAISLGNSEKQAIRDLLSSSFSCMYQHSSKHLLLLELQGPICSSSKNHTVMSL
ncbi:hypothetical protein QAD02_013376 [Eretmocerus hayati]|uniref:Uncharacterized protein n=1 Tax=Eretmocerus hayati TaxID=131215 RepID=A0ACC2P1Z6_9HYME|nr:hypothetical protein QAD02_013376 [Eretmocerus hayati]